MKDEIIVNDGTLMQEHGMKYELIKEYSFTKSLREIITSG